MLYNIYINDMENCIPNELSTVTCKYADDCSQYELVSIGRNSKVQEAVNSLKDWPIHKAWFTLIGDVLRSIVCEQRRRKCTKHFMHQ